MKVKDFLDIGANVGIIAGLILVGVQMQQNSDLLKTQLLFEEGLSYVQLEQTFIGENAAAIWAKSMGSPVDLTLEERRVIEGYLWSYLESWKTLYRLHELGLIGNEWRTRVESDAAFVFGSIYGRGWWIRYAANNTNPRELNELISESVQRSPNGTMDYFDSVTKEVVLENTKTHPEERTE
ncbi:hypothetical protein R0135_01055 [Congregibacter variabilis]|uniref:Uncharacterized protein n=1 Tax=Congregibacter variabilis TaxID=3081200 RepID=A0ABZ0I3M9_9GAMM|nr:hypothetical protein R0135_01055 [Congregibacter sp. IMCC43200]